MIDMLSFEFWAGVVTAFLLAGVVVVAWKWGAKRHDGGPPSAKRERTP